MPGYQSRIVLKGKNFNPSTQIGCAFVLIPARHRLKEGRATELLSLTSVPLVLLCILYLINTLSARNGHGGVTTITFGHRDGR